MTREWLIAFCEARGIEPTEKVLNRLYYHFTLVAV